MTDANPECAWAKNLGQSLISSVKLYIGSGKEHWCCQKCYAWHTAGGESPPAVCDRPLYRLDFSPGLMCAYLARPEYDVHLTLAEAQLVWDNKLDQLPEKLQEQLKQVEDQLLYNEREFGIYQDRDQEYFASRLDAEALRVEERAMADAEETKGPEGPEGPEGPKRPKTTEGLYQIIEIGKCPGTIFMRRSDGQIIDRYDGLYTSG